MKRKGKNIISFFLGVILMLLLIVAISASFIRFVFINPETYLNILHNKGCEEQIFTTINDNLRFALTVNNLPDDILEGVITKDDVYEKVDNYVLSIVEYLGTGENKVTSVNADMYVDNIYERIDKYFKDNSVEINDKLLKDIESLKQSMNQIIKGELEIINSDIIIKSSKIGILSSILGKFNTNTYWLFFVPILAIIDAIILLWFRNIRIGLRWICRSIIATGIILSLIFISGYISGFYNNVIIYIPYLKAFVSDVIRKEIIWMLTSGVITLIIGILMYIFTYVRIKKKKLASCD
ncbi:MAG: hypothetical protein E7214_05950 [Clostridium sp.]|nr:hypothetical protein [Clostridium sp.]